MTTDLKQASRGRQTGQLNASVPAELLRSFKIHCAENRVSVTDLVCKLLADHLGETYAPMPKGHGPGTLYLLRVESGRFKIGRSGNVARRITALRSELGQEVEFVWGIDVEDACAAENIAH